MDTVWSLSWSKCSHCYRCVAVCTQASLQKEDGTLGRLIFDDSGDVTFLGETYGCNCHHCSTELEGEEVHIPCVKVCPTGALRIYRE